MAQQDCIFCKIVEGQIPSSKIYEDNDFLAFLDIMPVNKGHVLVVPKKHYAVLEQMPAGLVKELYANAQHIGKALLKSLKPDGYNVFQNNHPAAGQVVHHVHVHIIPRYNNDTFKFTWPHMEYKNSEKDEFARKIISGFH